MTTMIKRIAKTPPTMAAIHLGSRSTPAMRPVLALASPRKEEHIRGLGLNIWKREWHHCLLQQGW